MGFPQKNADDASGSAFQGSTCELKAGGFTCPKCAARVEELPCECHICGLTLVSSPHLARSYHHLFPVKAFPEVGTQEMAASISLGGLPGSVRPPGWDERPGVHCYGCLAPLLAEEDSAPGGLGPQGGVVVRCSNCQHLFCFECDTYIHESLHNCPGCECQPDLAVSSITDTKQ